MWKRTLGIPMSVNSEVIRKLLEKGVVNKKNVKTVRGILKHNFAKKDS